MLLNGWLILKRKVLRRISGGIKVNENLRKRHNKVLMQPFGSLNILSLVRLDLLQFVKISRLNWIGNVNRTHSKIKVSQLF
jgi:hypothetical protein